MLYISLLASLNIFLESQNPSTGKKKKRRTFSIISKFKILGTRSTDVQRQEKLDIPAQEEREATLLFTFLFYWAPNLLNNNPPQR